MIVSISGIAFIELIIGCDTAVGWGIDILYVGVAIASVIVALGIFYPPGYAEEGRIGKGEGVRRGGNANPFFRICLRSHIHTAPFFFFT